MYDSITAALEEQGKGYLRHDSCVLMDQRLMELAEDEDYAAFQAELQKNGAGGFVYRELSIGDHITLADGSDLGAFGNQATDYGVCLESESLPDTAKGLETLTVLVKVKAYNVYCYMDLEKGATWYHEPAGEACVPVTVERSA